MDDLIRYTWVFFLVDKSDVFDTFKIFIKRIHNEFEMCIRHQFSAKYTPQSNSLVERNNRTLIDMARSMLSEYNVSHSFWAKVM